MSRRRDRRGIGTALSLLLLAGAAVGSCALASPSWPPLPLDPIPPERIPETIPAGALARCDSIRGTLDALFLAHQVPVPPDRSDPRLVSWVIQVLSFAQPGEVEAFGDAARPDDWAAADSAGALPLAAALALHEVGRDEQALAWCERGRSGRADHPYLDLLAVELYEAIGDSTGAARAAERLVASGRRNDAILRSAAVKTLDAREKDPDSLLRMSLRIRKILGGGPEESAARYRALTILRPAGAAAVGDTLMRIYPATRSARVEALRRLREKGRRIAGGERDDILDVLLRQRLFAEADTLLRRFPSDSLRIVRLEAMLAARQYDAIFADRTAKSPRWSRALLGRWHLVHARAARNTGRIGEMAARYASAAALGGETRQTALTEWAREAESNSRDRQADSLYTLLTRIPACAEEAHFRRGIARFASGRLSNAAADFALLKVGPFAAGGEFWLSRIARARGDSVTARALLARAAANPSGYYARRARIELGCGSAGSRPDAFWRAEGEALFRAGATRVPQAGAVACPAAPASRARADRIRLLRRFARGEWAEREQDLLAGEMPRDRRADRFFCLGLPDLAVRVAVGIGSNAPASFRYPRPYQAWILERAASSSIAPELIWAIARRESLFDPGALSSAGARGLLQMMDETAFETARRWGMSPGPLERGDRNLDLGLRHLGDLRKEHDWTVPAFLAAYNAGAAKTEEWVSRFPDPDLFIERIGWRETRDYVKSVLEACWIYRDALAGDTQ